MHLDEKSNNGVDKARRELSDTLAESVRLLSKSVNTTFEAKFALTKPLNEDDFQWTSSDGRRSGVRNLHQVIKTLEKVTGSGEESVSTAEAEWNSVDSALRLSAREILGDQGFASLMTDANTQNAWYSRGHQEMLAEVKAEQQHVLQLFEEARRSAFEELKKIEEVSKPCKAFSIVALLTSKIEIPYATATDQYDAAKYRRYAWRRRLLKQTY